MPRLSIALLLTLALPLLAQTPKAPRIICEQDTWDFGTQPQHANLTHKFKVKNVGTAPLRLINVIKSCTCAGAILGKKELLPGESGEIEARFETRTFKGPVSKVIVLVNNDPVNGRLRLTVKGRVTPPYWLSPQDLNLGDIRRTAGHPEGREFRLVLARNTTLKVTDLRSSNELLEVKPVPGEEGELMRERPDGSHEIVYRATLKPGYPVGLLQEMVTLRTSIAKSPVATLKVTGSVKGELTLTPKTFNLGRVPQGQAASREIFLTKAGDADLKIEAIKVSNPDVFTVETREVEAGRRYAIKVSVKKDAKRRYHKGKLSIRTNCPGEALQRAWFYAIVR